MKPYIKKPMIAALILQSIALVIAFAMYLGREKLVGARLGTLADEAAEMSIPLNIWMMIISLIMMIIYMLVMSSYEGEAYRGCAALMLAAWCVVSIISPYLQTLTTAVGAKLGGADSLAARSTLMSLTSLFTAPILTVSSVLAIVALGRFGVENEYREPPQMQFPPQPQFPQQYM